MQCPPHLILKLLNSSVVSLAQLVSPSVALSAELVNIVVVVLIVAAVHRVKS